MLFVCTAGNTVEERDARPLKRVTTKPEKELVFVLCRVHFSRRLPLCLCFLSCLSFCPVRSLALSCLGLFSLSLSTYLPFVIRPTLILSFYFVV
jgi:hypothetical protein